MNKAVIKLPIRVEALAIIIGLVAISLILSFRKPAAPPSVTFTGYTNHVTGGEVAVFTITNRSSLALDLLNSRCLVSRGPSDQTVVIWIPGTARPLHLEPGQIATVTLPRPKPLLGPWRASLEFRPSSPPFTYRFKRWLHSAGVPIATTPPTISTTSDIIYLTLMEAVHSVRSH